MNEADSTVSWPPRIHPRDWVSLTRAVIQIQSSIDGRAADTQAHTNLGLREGRLQAALVAPDGTIKKLFKEEDWQQRTIRVPLNPAEGVSVEPPFEEEGRVFIRRAGLDEWYPENPATPADRQFPAAGEIAEKAEPSAVADHESELSTRARRGRKPHDWELYRAKFYLMLDNDDVPAYADINISDYADRLMTWGRNNFNKSPEQAAMREKVAEWKQLWQRLKGASK